MGNIPKTRSSVPPIPTDTIRAVMEVYGKQSPYIRFGNALDEVLRDQLDELAMEPPTSKTTISNYLYALITYIQYFECATDEQMAEAVRKRIDLRYALRFNLEFPNILASNLCQFRRWLFANSAFHPTFATLVNRSSKLFQSESETEIHETDVPNLLVSICTMSRVERARELMLMTIEILTALYPDWMRTITPPFWYTRYSRSPKNTHHATANKDGATLLLEAGRDIKLLLDAISEKQDQLVEALIEVQNLRALWKEQFQNSQNKTCLLCRQTTLTG